MQGSLQAMVICICKRIDEKEKQQDKTNYQSTAD